LTKKIIDEIKSKLEYIYTNIHQRSIRIYSIYLNNFNLIFLIKIKCKYNSQILIEINNFKLIIINICPVENNA
jgi:hypothetical protein